MLKPKKAAKVKQVVPSIQWSRENPSESCKASLIKLIVAFYETETTVSLDTKYVRYEEDFIEKFKLDMKQRMLDALHVPEWYHETEKKNFLQFLDSKVHDALWNAKVILEKFGKEHRENDEAFEHVIMKADMFPKRCKPFGKRRNREGSVGWWLSKPGVDQAQNTRRLLITLPETARVIPQDNKIMRGGYATIRKVRIEGCTEIHPSWEFAAKTSLQEGQRPAFSKMEHNTESMAVRIPHVGVIRFYIVHARKNEGYSFQWNGGTLRQMLAMDQRYPQNIAI